MIGFVKLSTIHFMAEKWEIKLNVNTPFKVKKKKKLPSNSGTT